MFAFLGLGNPSRWDYELPRRDRMPDVSDITSTAVQPAREASG
jgi:hypothetical protein